MTVVVNALIAAWLIVEPRIGSVGRGGLAPILRAANGLAGAWLCVPINEGNRLDTALIGADTTERTIVGAKALPNMVPSRIGAAIA